MADKRLVDLTGIPHGKWTPLYFVKGTGKWVCQCECGDRSLVYSHNLKRGLSKGCKRCSCLDRWRGKVALRQRLISGRRGSVVVSPTSKRSTQGSAQCECRCDCGYKWYANISLLNNVKHKYTACNSCQGRKHHLDKIGVCCVCEGDIDENRRDRMCCSDQCRTDYNRRRSIAKENEEHQISLKENLNLLTKQLKEMAKNGK